MINYSGDDTKMVTLLRFTVGGFGFAEDYLDLNMELDPGYKVLKNIYA